MYMQDHTGRDIASNIANMSVDTTGLVKDTTVQSTNSILNTINSTLATLSPTSQIVYLTDRKTSVQSVSVPTGTYISILQLSITPGTWMISGTAVFPSNGTGYRHIIVSDTIDSSSSLNVMAATQPAFSGTVNNMIMSGVYVSDSNKTIYLTCRQSSGTDLSVYGIFNAVKIL